MQNEMLYRGDDLTFAPALCVTKNTVAGGLPQSGEATMIGDIAGVCTTTAFAAGQFPGRLQGETLGNVPATDYIAVKVKGVFGITVHPAAAVHPGAKVYFDPATGIVSDDNTKSFYGWYVPKDNINLNAGVDNLLAPVKLKH